MGPRNCAAETLQLRGRYVRHEKIPARARNGSCRVMVISRFPLPVPVSRFAWRESRCARLY